MRKIIALGLVFLFLFGCAQKSENLKLENVLEFEAKRSERIKAKEAAKATAPPAPVNSAPSPVPVIPLTEEPSPTPDFDFEPSELSELRLPAGFVFMNAEDLKHPEHFTKLLFTPSAGWKTRNGSVMILTSMTKMDPEKLGIMSKKDFMADVEKTGKEYGEYYQQTYKTPSSYEVKEADEVIYLKVTSKYLEGNTWKADIRYTYFYRPDYRLNVLITGDDEDIAIRWLEIQKSFDSFLKKIRPEFALPISFQRGSE